MLRVHNITAKRTIEIW